MLLYAKFPPDSTCPANTMQAISVLLSSVPLKQSKYEVPAVISCSISLVYTMAARVCFGSIGAEAFCKRRRDFSASSRRPLRTRCHGDSGAKQRIGMRNAGQTHWMAKGILEPSLVKNGFRIAWFVLPVAPFVGSGDQSVKYSSSDQLTNDEAHVGVGSQVYTDSQWQDFGSISIECQT